MNASGSVRVTGEQSSTGLEPHTAAMLAYLAWWITGLLFLALERENRYVRFHALQSTIALGGLSALGAFFAVFAFLTLLVSASGFRFFLAVAFGTWLLGIVLSLIALYKAYTGDVWKLPIAGEIAARRAGL